MLVRLEADNFYSIQERQILDLGVARNVPDDEGRFANGPAGTRVAKIAVIFGANASGKTNVLRTIWFLRWFVRNSFAAGPNGMLPFAPFAVEGSASRTTAIEASVIGTISDDLPRSVLRYRVEFVNFEAGKSIVSYEALFHAPRGKPKRLFERRHQKILGSPEFSLSANDPKLSSVRPNASVISTLAQFNHPPSLRLVQALQTVVGNIDPFEEAPSDQQASHYYSRNPASLKRLNEALPILDLGLREARIVPTGSGLDTRFVHGGVGELPMAFESMGTRRFFRSFPYLDLALDQGGIAIMDELDSHMHPVLLPEFLRWFRDPARNPHNAQLIATCQNPALLNHLSKEEIWFTEKNKSGATTLFGLKDIQGVRRDENFQRRYLDGAFGAVPQLG